jgi:hypothetical protein
MQWRTNICDLFAPSPQELAATNACVHLPHIGKFMRGRVGKGGRVQLGTPSLKRQPRNAYVCWVTGE